MEFIEHCAQIGAQTERVRAALHGADPTVPVPSCPGWNLGQLIRHLGGAHRWVEATVRTRAREPLPEEDFAFRDLTAFAHEDPSVLGPWLTEGAERLTGTLLAAGPESPVWVPIPGVPRTAAFFARRMAFETLIHGADALLALGQPVTIEPDIAAGALAEWLESITYPFQLERSPELRALLGNRHAVQLRASDTGGRWYIELGAERITVREGDGPASVGLHGPITELLLALYRRRPIECVEVRGDQAFPERWLDLLAFG
ncbi:maleylpyruvate isomerase family mycothiol-dependent enzyme [Sciscionella sediminilitoris]|uniref:maleylpyruvate isomerase family mycothiol-dependent enzyme n=1 Tax=Sciscionella sediminilitoris TaxID=1445613 RepID=UPI0004DFAD8F|nr:maleylpyruvate isomerase family mycothiol-dependent enzyme [Sciscionella sp. SE31]